VVKRIVNSSVGRLGDVAGDVCVGAGLSVGTIQVSSGGTGYTLADVIVSSPEIDGGVQATATAAVVAGIVTSVTITNSGSGYLQIPTVQIVNSDGNPNIPGSGAQATAELVLQDNYFYYCYRNFDGINNIWNRIQGSSW
jgi:predicted ATP-dependent Lon-type protease